MVGVKSWHFGHIDTGIAVVVGCGLALGRAVIVGAICRAACVVAFVFDAVSDIKAGQLCVAMMMMGHGHKSLRRDAHHRQRHHNKPMSFPCH
jgi:hypothetical protein